jgi:hypothetical protein
VRKGFLADQDHAKLANECSKTGLWLRALLAVVTTTAGARRRSCPCA